MLNTKDYLLLTAIVVIVSLITTRFAGVQQQQQQPQPQQPQQQQAQVVVVPSGGDDRYTIAPRPQRQWQTEYEIPTRGGLSQIYSRGPPETYQQMGIVSGSDGKLLPLYGRRVAPRSDYFNYYTRTDTYNPVQLPISFKRKDCQDNAGCAEVSSGDEVKISPTGETGKVTLYGFDGPRYN